MTSPTKPNIILDRMDDTLSITNVDRFREFKEKYPDNGLPKYSVSRSKENGEPFIEETYRDQKVGRFHVLMHRVFNSFIGPYPSEAEPIGVCFRLKTANRKLYEAALKRAIEMQDRGLGLLEQRTYGEFRVKKVLARKLA